MTGHARAGALTRIAGRLRSRSEDEQDSAYAAQVAREAAEIEAAGTQDEPGDWYGYGPTLTDNFPPPAPRSYAPEAVPLTGDVRTDLGALPLFRDTVHATFVRQEEARGFRAPHVPWDARYAGLYRARTALPVIRFGIADELVQAHEEAKEAVAAGIRGRIDRIAAYTGYGTEAAA